MRTFLVGTYVAAILAVPTVVPGQSAKPSPPRTPTSITLTGCVSRTAGAAGQYTFLESDGVRQYRLTGKAISKYAGRRVELVGGTGEKGLSIRGGLRPSPNVAAQAGAIDPAQAAIASQPGNGAIAAANFSDFRVMRVRGLEGACQ